MVQLENLQLVANVATTAVNAHGPLLINRLHDIHHDAEVALAATQVQTRHELRTIEPGF